MADVVLGGCRPEPIASYLKALGVLRTVSLGPDSTARGSWIGDRFVLRSQLDRDGLARFFLRAYRPTPFTAPWNGGSGFFPKDNQEGIAALRESKAPRFEPYRRAIAMAARLVQEGAFGEKATKEEKLALQQACLNRYPDDALEWVRAAFVITGDGVKYPPLLGTGGNDGRLEFSNNFMRRVVTLFDPATGDLAGSTERLLAAALFDEPVDGLEGRAIGQFLPSSAGGVNAAPGFEAPSLVNDWDFVLMLEGAVVLAAGSSRRMERDAGGALSYPFTVRAVGAGYESATEQDAASSRGEIWLPLWERPASFSEVKAVFAEGRAQVGGRSAANGIDFARAIATLGVDRGFSAFQRYGFLARNGLAYFATPLERFEVRYREPVAHLQEIDGWLQRCQLRIGGRSTTAPAAVRRAWRGLLEAILALCHWGDRQRLLGVLIELGRMERALGRSLRWTNEEGIAPVPTLSPAWLSDADDGSTELRLAAALASIQGTYASGRDGDSISELLPLRAQLEPVVTSRRRGRMVATWVGEKSRDVVWAGASLVEDLQAIMARRIVRAGRGRAAATDHDSRGGAGEPAKESSSSYPDRGQRTASLADIAAFVAGDIDEGRLSDLLWATILLDWARPAGRLGSAPSRGPLPLPALYPLLKLCFAGWPVREVEVPAIASIQRLAARGDAARSSAEAARRLRGSGLAPAIERTLLDDETTRRIAAAILFPIASGDVERLAERVLRPRERDTEGSDGETLSPRATAEPGGIVR